MGSNIPVGNEKWVVVAGAAVLMMVADRLTRPRTETAGGRGHMLGASDDANRALEVAPILVTRPDVRLRGDPATVTARLPEDIPPVIGDQRSITRALDKPTPQWQQAPRRSIPADVLDEFNYTQKYGERHIGGVTEMQPADNHPAEIRQWECECMEPMCTLDTTEGVQYERGATVGDLTRRQVRRNERTKAWQCHRQPEYRGTHGQSFLNQVGGSLSI